MLCACQLRGRHQGHADGHAHQDGILRYTYSDVHPRYSTSGAFSSSITKPLRPWPASGSRSGYGRCRCGTSAWPVLCSATCVHMPDSPTQYARSKNPYARWPVRFLRTTRLAWQKSDPMRNRHCWDHKRSVASVQWSASADPFRPGASRALEALTTLEENRE